MENIFTCEKIIRKLHTAGGNFLTSNKLFSCFKKCI